jgi:hypothetical protein
MKGVAVKGVAAEGVAAEGVAADRRASRWHASCRRASRRLVTDPVGAVLVALAVLAGSCASVEPLAVPDVDPEPLPRIVVHEPEPSAPAGTITVAVPAEPTGWIVPEGDDVASHDLAALWSLPLYRVDPTGAAVRALAVDERVSEDGRTIDVDLAPGEWTDGSPVQAEDVVATVEALRGTPLGADLDVVAEVTVVEPGTVRFELSQPTVRWQLLLGSSGILPAHVLEEGGLDAAASLEVTGGGFRLAGHEPGLGATFHAHAGSPLGAPALEELRVLVVPNYDVALGLLDEGGLDAAVGYLAVGAVGRAEALGLGAAAPVGGTWVGLRWSADAGVEPAVRRGVATAIDVAEQVEGLGLGEELQVPVLEGPAPDQLPTTGEDDLPAVAGLDASLVVRADEEALLLTGRLIEAQVRAQEGRLTLRRERTPTDVAVARETEAVLQVRRDPPRPDLVGMLGEEDGEVARLADAAPSAADDPVIRALATVLEEARMVALYRPPVAHVWRPQVAGIEPSAWPGTGLASAMRWRLDATS